MSKFILSGFGDEISPNMSTQMDVMEKLGISHIEFRSAEKKNVADHTVAEIKEIHKAMGDRGFAVSSVGSPIGKVDITEPIAPHIEKLRHIIDIAHAFETKYIRLFSFFIPEGDDPASWRNKVIDQMGAMVQAAEGEGLMLLHENERYIYGDIPERCLDILTTINSPILRAVYDPANFVHCEVKNYPHAYKMLEPWIEYMHIKDCVYQKTQRVLDMGFQNVNGNMQRVSGEGEADMYDVLSSVYKRGFDGFLSLEPHLGEGADTFSAAAVALQKMVARIEEENHA